MEATQGKGGGCVFEAAGTEDSMNMATRVLRKERTLALTAGDGAGPAEHQPLAR